MTIVEALHDQIVATPAIAAVLATYDFGAGAAPAVFTGQGFVPHDAELPAIVITEVGGVPFETRGRKGMEQTFDLMVWGDKRRSLEGLRALATAVYFEMHHVDLAVDGYGVAGVYAAPPQQTTDPEGFPGFRVPLMVRVLKC